MNTENDTDIPRWLTPEEVAELPDGTEVFVWWSGGKQGFCYVVEQLDGVTYAQIPSDPKGVLRLYNPLRFIGKENYHTRVRKV